MKAASMATVAAPPVNRKSAATKLGFPMAAVGVFVPIVLFRLNPPSARVAAQLPCAGT
jgi:hypothetical protein